MEVFTSWQGDLLRNWLLSTKTLFGPTAKRTRLLVEEDTPGYGELNRPALAALATVTALNVPPIVYFRYQYVLAGLDASKGWAGSIAGWFSAGSPISEHVMEMGTLICWNSRIKPIRERLMLRSDGGVSGWWTFITCNFMHAESWHFQANMRGLLWNGIFCARIPGMGALEMLGLTLFGGLGTSFGLILHQRIYQTRVQLICGISGVVCAFQAVAALGAPRERVRLPSGQQYSIRWLNMYYFISSRSEDVRALLNGGSTILGMSVGHAGHLSGALSGALFYFLVLYRRRQPRAKPITHHLYSKTSP